MFRQSMTVLLVGLCVTCGGARAADSWREITPDVIYGHKAGMALTLDVVRPAQNANGAAVLFLVSGGWVSTWLPPETIVRDHPSQPNVWEKIVQRGYTLYLVRHGSSPHFKIPDAVADVRRAVRFVRMTADRFGVDPDRIGVCGGSAGGHLSLVLGTTADEGNAETADPVERFSSRVRAVVAYFPPTDLRPYMAPDSSFPERFPALKFPIERADEFSPLRHVSPDDAPSLLIHGDRDDLVPLSHSENISAAFGEHGVVHQLIVIQGAGHGFADSDRQRAEQALVEWFDQHLKPAQ